MDAYFHNLFDWNFFLKIALDSIKRCSVDVNEEEGEGGQGGEKKSAQSCTIDVDEDYSEMWLLLLRIELVGSLWINLWFLTMNIWNNWKSYLSSWMSWEKHRLNTFSKVSKFRRLKPGKQNIILTQIFTFNGCLFSQSVWLELFSQDCTWQYQTLFSRC